MRHRIVYVLFFVALSFSSTSCDFWNETWGNFPLGNNLSLLEGDRKEDRIIVYCSGRSAGTCLGGIPVVPEYKRQFDANGRYAEYVITARSNKRWVIVKTFQIKQNQENYWIVSKNFNIQDVDCVKNNCDSILQSYVQGPFNKNKFEEKKAELEINVAF